MLPITYHTPNNAAVLEPLLLSVSVNQHDMPEIIYCYRNSNGELFISSTDLSLWGLQPPPHLPFYYKQQRYYNLHWYKGLHYKLDEHILALTVDIPPGWLPTTVVNGRGSPKIGLLRPQHPGLILNYDITFSHDSRVKKTSTAGLLDFTLFNRFGIGVNDLLFISRKKQSESNLLRLETNWTLDEPENIIRWRFGDSITGASNWSGAVRFAGIQYATDFSMQPNLVTFPLPRFRGEAVAPSIVNVFVNDALRQSESVASGPFLINTIPVVTGSGTIRIVTKDILGREYLTILPYYSARELLKLGLSDYSFEAGFVRKNFGIKSFDYGHFVAVGTYSHGMTLHYTLESHLEASHKRQTLGFTNYYLLPEYGIFILAFASSHSQVGGWGGLVKCGFHRQTAWLSFGAQTTLTTPEFTHIGLQLNDHAPRLIVQAFTSLNTHKWGTISLSYTKTEHQVSLIKPSIVQIPEAELLTASYHKNLFKNISLLVNSVFDLRRSRNNRASASFVFSLDRQYNGSVETIYHDHHLHPSVSFNKPAPIREGWGYRLLAANNSTSRFEAGVTWHTPVGAYNADYALVDGRSHFKFDAIGSIIYFHKREILARFSHSFALVEIPDFSHVRVYHHKEMIGYTNAHGYLLLPNLLPYEENEISINPKDFPLNTDLGSIRKKIIPYRRSGALVKFRIKKIRYVTLQLILPGGKSVPIGANIRISRGNSKQNFPVGYAGEVYLSIDNPNLDRLSGVATWGNAQCHFSLRLPKKQNTMVLNLGANICSPAH